MPIVYKISPQSDWTAASRAGVYAGSPDDRRDGFIHLSAAHQVAGTLARHFADHTSLVLAAYEAQALGPALKWETSRGGELFPHLHGALDPAAAMWVKPLPYSGGAHHLPDLSAT